MRKRYSHCTDFRVLNSILCQILEVFGIWFLIQSTHCKHIWISLLFGFSLKIHGSEALCEQRLLPLFEPSTCIAWCAIPREVLGDLPWGFPQLSNRAASPRDQDVDVYKRGARWKRGSWQSSKSAFCSCAAVLQKASRSPQKEKKLGNVLELPDSTSHFSQRHTVSHGGYFSNPQTFYSIKHDQF